MAKGYIIGSTLLGGGLGGGGAFSPTDISGLQLWLKSDGVLWQDSARTTPVTADNDPVGAWDDASGGSLHVLQATAASRPTYKTNIKNGRAVVRFDNTDDFLRTASSFSGTANWSAFAVCVQASVTSPANVLDADDSARWAQHLRHNGGNAEVIAFDTVPNAYTDTEAWTSTNWAVLSAVRDGTTAQVWVNATSGGSTATAGTNSTASERITVGAHGPGVTFWNGDIGEIILYNSALSAGDRGRVESYLNSRWAVF